MNTTQRAILVIPLLMALCFSAAGQKQEFQAAIQKGRAENGYYHAVFSAGDYVRSDIYTFARENKYIVKRIQEKYVLQYGSRYKAVTALDFISIEDEPIIKNLKPSADQMAQVNDLMNFFEGQGGAETVQYRQAIGFGAKPISSKVVCAAAAVCGYYLYDHNVPPTFFSSSQETYSFLSERGVADRVSTLLQEGSRRPYSAEGSAFMYHEADYLRAVRLLDRGDVRWTGNLENGRLDGAGSGYWITPENQSVHCFVGRFENGKPMGTCRFYDLSTRDVYDKKWPKATVVEIDPVRDGMAKCVFTRPNDSVITAFLNSDYSTAIANIDYIPGEFWDSNAFAINMPRTNVVKGFENGYATLSWLDERLGFPIEFTVDRKGQPKGITAKTQSNFNALLNELVSHYDKYLSKVINPTDILKPEAALKSRLSYSIENFPYEKYRFLTSSGESKTILEEYKRSNARNASKVDLAINAYKLLNTMHGLEKLDRQERRQWVNRIAATANTKREGLFSTRYLQFSDHVPENLYHHDRQSALENLEAIRKSPNKPANLDATTQVVKKACDETINWWAGVYASAKRDYDARLRSDIADRDQRERDYKWEMCEKCLIDGKKTTFPEGYLEGLQFLFLSTPATSKESGTIVLQNGEECTWDFIYYEYSKGIKLKGDYSGDFDGRTFDEAIEKMVEYIQKECKKKWGQ